MIINYLNKGMKEKKLEKLFFEPPSLGLKMAASGPRVKFCDPPFINLKKKYL